LQESFIISNFRAWKTPSNYKQQILETNGLDRYTRPEKITSIVIIFAILLFPAKWIYYDTGKLNALEFVFPVLLGAGIITLVMLKELRKRLFLKWLGLMIYAPVVIIVFIVLGIIYYFFQVIFANGPMDGGGE